MKNHAERLIASVMILASLALAGADWTRFRGPDATGVADDKGLPLTWTETENVLWKTPLPGFGASSPITLGDKIFLTCYSGYATGQEKPGSQEELAHHLLCIDRRSGKIVWDKAETAQLPEQEYRGFIALHGYASATPTTDGQAVYAYFGRSGARAYSLAGEPLWQFDAGKKIHSWGSAASPILYKNLLIINASVESGSLIALDKTSGKEVWRIGGIVQSWSTPLVLDLPGGKQELIVSIQGKVLGLDPATGKSLWQCDGVPDYVCPAVIAHGDVVFITAGKKPMALAVRAGGSGDVSKTNVLWRIDKGSKVPTPLYHDGRLYWIDQRGIFACVEAETGKLIFEQHLKIAGGGDKIYASLVLGDGKLYAVTRQGGTFVFAPGTEYKELAHNDLGDKSIFNGTPVIGNGQLLIRSDRFLYCIGK